MGNHNARIDRLKGGERKLMQTDYKAMMDDVRAHGRNAAPVSTVQSVVRCSAPTKDCHFCTGKRRCKSKDKCGWQKAPNNDMSFGDTP